MKKLLLKLFLKLIGEDPFEIISQDAKNDLQEWLFDSFEKRGQKSYYTLRKKFIQNELSIGMEEKEYWKRIGRLEELRALNENIQKEADRRKKIEKQHN